MHSSIKNFWGKANEIKIRLLYVAGGLMFITLLELFAAKFRLAGAFRLNYLNLGSFIWSPLSRILALLAVWGLFPVHTDQTPRSSRIGTIFLGISLLTLFGLLVGNILNNIGKILGSYTFVPSFLYSTPYTMIYLIVLVGTFILFSYSVFNTDDYPDMLGYVMLILAIIMVGWIGRYIISLNGIQVISREILSWISISFEIITMLSYFAMGYIISKPDKLINFQIGRYLNSTQHRM